MRRSRVLPTSFETRFRARLADGTVDWMQALDYCELNPSPGARVVLSAIRRWGRPTTELERAVTLAAQNEVAALRRHTGPLRRVAALAPLIGLLGSLAEASRTLGGLEPGLPLGPAIAAALTPLICAVGLAILALLAYDGIAGRIDSLAMELDRIGLDTVEALGLLPAASSNRTSSTTHRAESASSSYSAPLGVRPGMASPDFRLTPSANRPQS